MTSSNPLQIHDELVLEVEKTVVKEVGVWLRTCMENAASLKGSASFQF